MNNKYVRVMDGLKSNAGGFEYKLDEINVTEKWNPNVDDAIENASEYGGFNFSTEEKILRWVHRGDTIYDVIIPDDAELIEVDSEKGIYRANKIIVTNPRKLTEDLILDYCKKTTLSDKVLAQCLYIMLWKKMPEISKYIIKNNVTRKNVELYLTEFGNYGCNGEFSYEKLGDDAKELYDIMEEIKSPFDISLYVSKEPYIKEITKDNVINLTGQSGSGKSFYAKEKFNTDEYEVIDTDEVLSDKRFAKATGLNKEIGEYLRNKYETLPNLSDDFDLIYNEILNYCKNINKTIVIDCAQFHCIKDLSLLKGKIIIIRTDIDTCYNRTISRWINNHTENNIEYNEEELQAFKDRKKSIYKWYKGSNEFIRKIDEL